MKKKSKRDYYVPSQTKLIEVAEAFADEISSDRNSKSWKKAREHFLDEAIHESILPADSKYAQNPKIADSVMSFFPDHFGAESVLAKALGNSDAAVRKTRELRGVITQLTHLILESKFKMKVKGKIGPGGTYTPSDFEFPKDSGSDEVDTKNVYIDRYLRLAIFTAINQALEPIFKISKDEMQKIASTLEEKSIAELKSKEGRESFISKLKKFVSEKYGSKSIFE